MPKVEVVDVDICPWHCWNADWSFCAIMTVRALKEELQLLHEQGSYVGEVVKAMDKKKVLVKVGIPAP